MFKPFVERHNVPIFAILPKQRVLLSVSACQDLDRFSTEGDVAYCGELVTAEFAHDGLLPDDGAPSLSARLELDIDAVSSLPGRLWTDDAERGLCSPDPLFSGARLRAIQQALHDAIASLEFGEGIKGPLGANVHGSTDGKTCRQCDCDAGGCR